MAIQPKVATNGMAGLTIAPYSLTTSIPQIIQEKDQSISNSKGPCWFHHQLAKLILLSIVFPTTSIIHIFKHEYGKNFQYIFKFHTRLNYNLKLLKCLIEKILHFNSDFHFDLVNIFSKHSNIPL